MRTGHQSQGLPDERAEHQQADGGEQQGPGLDVGPEMSEHDREQAGSCEQARTHSHPGQHTRDETEAVAADSGGARQRDDQQVEEVHRRARSYRDRRVSSPPAGRG